MNKKWDSRFLKMAHLVSEWSKDPSTQVGAVIVDKDKRVVSIGYNGFPRGVEDSSEKLADREYKYKTTVHAEVNALIFAKRSIEQCTLYTFPFLPCGPCCSMFIQAGISRIVTLKNDVERWQKDFEITKELCKEAGVEVKIY